MLEAVAAYIGAALLAGEAGIVVATAAHRHGLQQRLTAAGLDVATACSTGQYVALDAAETLGQLMVADAPQSERFSEIIGSVVARAMVIEKSAV